MIKEKNIEINKNWLLIIKILLIISCPFFTLMISNRFYTNHIIIGCMYSFIFGAFLFRNIKINSISNRNLIIYFIISCYFITNNLLYANTNIITIREILKNIINTNNLPQNTITKFIGLMALPTTIFFVKWFHEHIYSKIKDFFNSLTNTEKVYICITLIEAFIISMFIINNTAVFSRPKYDYDILFTSDTGILLRHNAFINISFYENDIRQPLFGLFATPIGLTAKVISKFCFFFRPQYEYENVMTIFQFLLLSISTILISRLLKISEDKKKYFYILISCSFPYILFSTILEQYPIAVFYLILTIYYYFQNPYKVNYLYIGAVGTLFTSGIIFPLITKFKNFKQWIKSILKCFIAFVGTVTISGQLPQIFTLSQILNILLGKFAEGKTLIDKFYQYTAFVKGLFIPNPGHIELIGNRPTYQSLTYTHIEWIGIIILLLCIISFILNRKNKMALVSMLWIIYSIIILIFVGWGTVENGLILYSLYFAWAFYSMIYLLIIKIFKNKQVFKFIIAVLVSLMMTTNIYELINIFIFAIKYYP